VPPEAPPSPPQQSLQTFIPKLNRYIQAKVNRVPGEVSSYIDAVTALGSNGAAANSKQLASAVLPRLALYGALPPSLVPQLLPQLISDDYRAARLAAYLVQVQLGCGAAGTPTLPPTRGGEVLVPSPVPVEIMAWCWRDVVNEDASTRQLQMALRNLAVAKRGYPTLLKKDLVTGIQTVLKRAKEVVDPLNPSKKAHEDAAVLRHTALLATRVGVTDAKAAQKITEGILREVISPNPVTARHALALAVDFARKSPTTALEFLGVLVTDTAVLYETLGPKEACGPPKKQAAPTETINLQDKWGRVYLARLCSAVVHSTSGSLSGQVAGFYQMLTLLATRDDSTMVGMEAVKSLAGYFPQRQAGLGLDGAALEVTAQDARSRARAWQVLQSQADTEAVGGMFASGLAATLIGVIGERVMGGLQSGSPAVVCSAARAAGALGEARMRSGMRTRKRGAETAAVLAEIAEELQLVAEGRAGPAIRCPALEALFWFEEPGQPPRITPLSLLRNVTSSGEGQAAWPRDLLEAVMSSITRAERATPASSRLLMSCAGAVAAASPSGVNLSRVVEMWTAAIKAGRAGKEAALHAALGILSSPSPPSANAPTGASIDVLAQAASEDAAWLAFQRMSAWWLGENANVAAGEYAGTSGVVSSQAGELGTLKPPSGRVDIATHGTPLSAGEVIALQAAENPAMMAVVAQLQHAVLTMPWEVRIAAAQAIAKVAVRSEEPYRIHCYSILRSLAASDRATGNDPLGVAAVVTPAVKLLDRIYATRITLEGLAAKYGERPLEWPVHVVEQLTERNHVILSQIEEHIGSMPTGLFHPLGPVGRELLRTVATEGLEAFRGGLEQQKAADEEACLAREMQASDSGYGSAVPSISEAAAQSKVGVDGRPEWMQRLEGMQPPSPGAQQADSSDEEDADEDAQVTSTFTPADGGTDTLAEMMAQLDQQIAGPVRKREAWEQLPTPSEVVSAGDWQPPTPKSPPRSPLRSQHSRQSSWAEATPKRAMEGKAEVIYDFSGTDEQELTVFAGQQVSLQYESDAWMMVTTDSGRSGLVPSSFLNILTQNSPFSQPFNQDPFVAKTPTADAYARVSSDPFSAPDAAYDDPFAEPTPRDDPFAAEATYDDPFAEDKPAQAQPAQPSNDGGIQQREISFSENAIQPSSPVAVAAAATAQQARSPINAGAKVRHMPRPSLLNIDDDYMEANAAAGSGPVQEDLVPQQNEPSFANYVAPEPEPEVVAQPPRRLRRGKVTAAFVPEGEGEVAVQVGDLVEVDGEEEDGWVDIVRLSDGVEGIIPAWSVSYD